MKINTNSFGNYSLNNIKLNGAKASSAGTEAITKEEKKFFAGLYPENNAEILNYDFYNPKGKVNGVIIGSLFDRRG